VDEPALQELRAERVEVEIASPVAEALDERSEGHVRAEDPPQAAQDPDVSTREDLHAPESPQQHDRGGPRSDPGQRIQTPQRGLRRQALELVPIELPAGDERCDVPQRLELGPAEADSGEAPGRRRRHVRRLRKGPGPSDRRVEARAEPLHEAGHEHAARLQAQLLVRDGPAEGLEQGGKARRPRAPQRPLERPKPREAGSAHREARVLLEAEHVGEGSPDRGEARARDRARLEGELERRGVDRPRLPDDAEEVLPIGREDAAVGRPVPDVDDVRRPPLQQPDGRFEVERASDRQLHVRSGKGLASITRDV
jgi:hypothetical protein